METEAVKVRVYKNTKTSVVLSAGSVRTGHWVWFLSQGFMYFKSVKCENISEGRNKTSGDGKKKRDKNRGGQNKNREKKRF